MRTPIIAIAATMATTAMAQTPAAPAAPAAPSAPAAPAAAHYTTAETDIGTLMGNQVIWAIVVRHIPELNGNEQLSMARAMTLRAIQPYAPDKITSEKLAAIDAELAQLTH